MNAAVHLTDDQIDDYLIGDLAESWNAHVATCAECQVRIAELKSAIDSFKDVSLAWSERQSATVPVRLAGSTRKISHKRRAIWVATATAAIAVSVAIPLMRHEPPLPAPTSTDAAAAISAHTFAAERQEQIAQDNQMLRNIDREIGTPVSSPSEVFGLELESEPSQSRNTTVQD